MAFIDKQLTCRDCSKPFIFTGGEQEFYASKGLQNEPVRCPPCRTARKNNRPTEPEEGYVRYGVFASFGGRTPRQMHPATCAECGMMTEVPFQPRGDRPVYCSACYNKIRGAEAEAAAKPADKKASSEKTTDESEEAVAEAPAAEAEAPSETPESKLKELAEAAFPADDAAAKTEEKPEDAEAESPAAAAESTAEVTDSELKELAEAAFPADQAAATTEEKAEEAEPPVAEAEDAPEETADEPVETPEADSASEETGEAESTADEEEATAKTSAS